MSKMTKGVLLDVRYKGALLFQCTSRGKTGSMSRTEHIDTMIVDGNYDVPLEHVFYGYSGTSLDILGEVMDGFFDWLTSED